MRRHYWSGKNKLPNLVIESYQLKSAEIQKEDIYSLSVGEILSEKAVGTVVKGYHENQYFYIFLIRKEGNFYSLKKHHNLAKKCLYQHTLQREISYVSTSNQSRLVGERQRKVFFKIIKNKKTVKEQKNEKKSVFLKSVTIFLSIFACFFPSFNYLVFPLWGNSE